jgi:mannose-1-phosphate guanylyltransferase
MQALVLAGGEGTRLRPLTLTMPKPALTLVDRPFVAHMIDWVARHGVTDVVIACGFGSETVREALHRDPRSVPRVSFVEEPEPLGTAGPLRLAADQGLLEERFLVLNGDLLADLDLSELIRAHAAERAAVTIAVHPVADPRSYGLVRRARGPAAPEADPAGAGGEVLGFLEKPSPEEIDTDEVNAGAYVVERGVVDLIPPARMCSIEREIFPRLVGQGLYGHRLEGYWMDVGTPERYLEATWDILEGRVRTEAGSRLDGAGVSAAEGTTVDPAASVRPPAFLEPKVSIEAGAVVGSRAVIGRASAVGEGAEVAGSVVLRGCTIGSEAAVRGAILAPRVVVGDGARIEAGSVVGEGARIAPGAEVEARARVAPGSAVR